MFTFFPLGKSCFKDACTEGRRFLAAHKPEAACFLSSQLDDDPGCTRMCCSTQEFSAENFFLRPTQDGHDLYGVMLNFVAQLK